MGSNRRGVGKIEAVEIEAVGESQSQCCCAVSLLSALMIQNSFALSNTGSADQCSVLLNSIFLYIKIYKS